MIELKRYHYLYLFYLFAGIARTIYQFALLQDLQQYNLTLAEIQQDLTFIELPWGLKFVYAVIMDSFPIFGSKKKSYLIIANLLSCIFCGCLMIQYLQEGQELLFYTLLMWTLCVTDVGLSAIMLEEAHLQPLEEEGTLQNRIEIALSIGGIIGIGCRYALWYSIGSKGTYALWLSVFIITLIICFFITENPTGGYNNVIKREPVPEISPTTRNKKQVISIELDENGNPITTKYDDDYPKPINISTIPKKQEKTTNQFFKPIISYWRTVCWVVGLVIASFKNKYLRVPLTYALITNLLPSAAIPTFYFVKDIVRFSSQELTVLAITAELVKLPALVLFDVILRKFQIRNIYVIVAILRFVAGIAPVFLVIPADNTSLQCLRYDPLNETITYNDTCYFYEEKHIPPLLLALGDTIAGSITDELNFLPIRVITKTVCFYPGALTQYQSTMSLMNLGSFFQWLINARITDLLNINHKNYAPLITMIQLGVSLDFLSFCFLYFFPTKTLSEIKQEVDEERNWVSIPLNNNPNMTIDNDEEYPPPAVLPPRAPLPTPNCTDSDTDSDDGNPFKINIKNKSNSKKVQVSTGPGVGTGVGVGGGGRGAIIKPLDQSNIIIKSDSIGIL